MEVLIAGCGEMGTEYCRILQSLGHMPIVIGRGDKSAADFLKKTGITSITGGVDNFCTQNKSIPTTAIVAVSVDQLFSATKRLMKAGCKRLLVEKPGGATYNEIEELYSVSKKYDAEVLIGYNRRYFPSVRRALEIIDEDGGITSFHFEFTEWAHRIEPLEIPEIIKRNWYLANSTHVIDLAFFIGGQPSQLSCYTNGELSWHKPSSFAGAGTTSKGGLFTYRANWNAPGRWGAEFLTTKRRLILQPLEELKVINKGSVNVENAEIVTDPVEADFKPGLYYQTVGFLKGKSILPTLANQVENIETFLKKINEGRSAL